VTPNTEVDSSWNVMAHGDAREGKWVGNWRMQWVASTLHTTSEHGVSSITTVDAHTSAASSRLNWPLPPPGRFKWTRPFRPKDEILFCACAITFETQSTGKVSRRYPMETYLYAFLINVRAVLICEPSASLLRRSAAVEGATNRLWDRRLGWQ